MPTIACPSCQKTYKISSSAAGKTANCKCGKKFRLGKAKSAKSSSSAATPSISKRTKAKSKASVASAKVGGTQKRAAVVAEAAADDDFWDDEISTDLKLAKTETPAVARSAPVSATLAAAEAELKKKKKKVKWGFRWDKVFGGGAAFLGAGLATLFLLFTTGRIFIYLAVIAIGGLFTMLSGLMGEEGIWGDDEFD